ncbi:FCD domain-containing protein [Labrys neptuniae]
MFEQVLSHPRRIENGSKPELLKLFGRSHAALLANFRLTNRASESHGNAIMKHRAVFNAIRLREPEAARQAMM